MPPKHIRRLFISMISMIIIINVVSCSMIFNLQKSWNNKSQSHNDKDNSKPYILAIEIKIPRAVSQDNTTNETATTNTTATDTTTTTESTNTTDTNDLPPWNPYLVDENLYYPLALVFSFLGILSTLWLVFFVETSKDRTIRERIIGSSVRLIFMSIFVGLSLHFWILFEPI